MNIRQKIRDVSIGLAKKTLVTDVRIGLGYTAVLLDNGQMGLAYTFHRDLTGGCTVFRGLRPLRGRPAAELLTMFDSTDKIEAAVALATSNALTNTGKDDVLEGDTLEYLTLHSDDTVGMVGYFGPMVPLLRKKVSSLNIFEQVDRQKGDILPQADAFRLLPHCDVALITSTSILNRTVDDLLDAARSCREIALLGASTPLIPEAFADSAVSILSGVVVTRPLEIMRVVSEGGGMRLFKNYIRKVNVIL